MINVNFCFLGQFKLMTEMFHITHSALHIGLTTTLQHYNKIYRYVQCSFSLGNKFSLSVSISFPELN